MNASQKNIILKKSYIEKLVKIALKEDIGHGDITSELIPKSKNISAYILTREKAVICGIDFVNEAFHSLNKEIEIEWFCKDKDFVEKNQKLCCIKGQARCLLSGERTALNFLQSLSGTATKTKAFVDAVSHTKVKILDTRKTIPGLRLAQKYAVSCGGGTNHRLGLFDAFLIKENHIMAMGGSISSAIRSAKSLHPKKKVEIEARSLDEFQIALSENADIIMLDNFDISAIKNAVKINKGKAKLEVSGGITLENIAEFAETEVDFISVGALTKDVKAVDLSMLHTTHQRR